LNDFKDLYEIGEPLSQETYVHATAYLCTEKATGDAKQVLRFEDNKLSSQNESKNLLYDCVLLQQLVHDNIVKTFNFFEKEVDEGECTHYWIVMEPMNQCKQLLDQIEKKDCYKEADAASVIKAMLGAISYVHGKGQAHGDLRP
jgi:serine/threonine protein kinase